MRIGIFCDTYSPYISGVCTSIVTLKSSLEKLGHEVYVVTIAFSNKHSYDEKERVLRVVGIDSGIYNGVKFSTIYPLYALNKIRKWKLDVIHSQTEGSIGTFSRIISKQYNIPLVHTYHTMYEDYMYLVTKGYFDKPAKKLLEYLTTFYCDKMVSELIVPTKKTYDLFKNKYGVKRDIHIIPTGIDINKFSKSNFNTKKINELKEENGIKKDDFVLLVVSRISKEKNIQFLITNHKSINKGNKNIKLVIVGDGPILEDLKKKTSKNGNIIFLGKVPWEDIALYYQIGDVFVTASKTETQGLTVNEALASSLPVVCIEDESYKLSVIDGYNGFFFKNKKEYREKVINLYKDKVLYNNISKQAEDYSSNFSDKHFAESVIKVYKQAISKEKVTFIDKIKNIVKGVKNE